ncbi:hypothetical protein CK203_014184 [Vitis vinifera]|uniref:RNase H type-1 domain-containing protein n=1 Tax=Vitis vinifera TaxID=29760 RepID=A0A438JHX9_VITVI|nr:hypothetical protein CK203_014184 [Vitis vinifera]
MKGHVMTDFVVESLQRPARDEKSDKAEWWTLQVDGASRSSGSGVGLLLQFPNGEQLEQAIRLGFLASNNKAEYEAILFGLDLALALSVSKLRIYSDSQLVVRHIQEEYEVRDERMTRYLTKVRDTLQRLGEWTIEKVRRADNVRSDTLAGITTSFSIKEAILLPIYVQTSLSITETPACNAIEESQKESQEWTRVIKEYLRTCTLPEDSKCLDQYVLVELHEGVCGNHPEGRSLAHWAHSQGYYWTAMKNDAATYVKKCDKCQRHAPIPHVPSETLNPITSP